MSSEKMGTTNIPCPCGQGSIYQEHYMDDWNRFDSTSVVIDCDVCSKKYKIKSEHFYPKPYHDYTIYYLVPVDDPQHKIKLNI